jgi:transcriptional regulator with XRE-family HTH domain
VQVIQPPNLHSEAGGARGISLPEKFERDAMDKIQLLIQLRTKKISALIYDARVAAGRSIKDCAEAMGVSKYQFKAYESGEQSPSLPELEVLSYYLNVPLEHFWGAESLSEAPMEKTAQEVENFIKQRNQDLVTRLRQARDEAGLSLDELAENCGIDKDLLGKYELGETTVPVPHLELLARRFNIEISQLFDQSGMISSWRCSQETLDGFMDLPDELKSFVSKPINRAYLELAHRLSSLSVEKLRMVAEGLLEITY